MPRGTWVVTFILFLLSIWRHQRQTRTINIDDIINQFTKLKFPLELWPQSCKMSRLNSQFFHNGCLKMAFLSYSSLIWYSLQKRGDFYRFIYWLYLNYSVKRTLRSCCLNYFWANSSKLTPPVFYVFVLLQLLPLWYLISNYVKICFLKVIDYRNL